MAINHINFEIDVSGWQKFTKKLNKLTVSCAKFGVTFGFYKREFDKSFETSVTMLGKLLPRKEKKRWIATRSRRRKLGLNF